MAKRLVVVIPTAGSSALLHRTLDSLAQCEKPACYSHTIVVENGPAGIAQGVADSAPADLGVEYVHVPRANKSNALNLVFAKLAPSDLVYLTDDDVRFDELVLTRFATAAEGVVSGVVFGGPLDIDSDGEPPAEWLDFLPGSMKGWKPTAAEFDSRHSHFLGANWALFVSDFLAAGMFDPRFGPGSPLGATGQEWNIQKALRRNQVQFQYVPDAMVWHHVDFTRFSPDFLLHRKYRGGLEAGIQEADRMWNEPRWRDYVRHPLMRARWRFARHWLGAKLAGKGRENELKQFVHRLGMEHARGFLKSYPIATQELRENRDEEPVTHNYQEQQAAT